MGTDKVHMKPATGAAWNLRTTRRAITTLTVAAFPIVLIGVTWASFPERPEEFRDKAPDVNLLGTPVPTPTPRVRRSKRQKREKRSTRRNASASQEL